MFLTGPPVTLAMKRARHDEFNLARLNLVLSVNRTNVREWRKELVFDIMGTIRVECTALHNDVVPHGTDNDLLVGLISAAVIQNVEPGGTIYLSASELLRLSSLPDNARSYRLIVESLDRLRDSRMRIIESWLDKGKQQRRTVTFSLVTKHWQIENNVPPGSTSRWQADTLLAIRLDEELTRSIHYGLIRPLDSEILEKLGQPMSRSVYRALSLLRTTIGQDTAQEPTAVTLSLLSWAEHLGITHQFQDQNLPGRIARALAPAHEDLTHAKYLSSVRIEGRGRKKTVTYHFATAEVRPANPETAQLLAPFLPERKALELSTQYSPQHAREVIAMFKALLANGYKPRNKDGLLIDMLRDPERYRKAGPAVPEAKTASRALPQQVPEPEMPKPDRKAFEMVFERLKDKKVFLPLKDRLWVLYDAGHIKGVDIFSLNQLPSDQVLEQLSLWETT